MASEFIDCSCLGVLIAQLRAWREQIADTKLGLQNVAPSIARMLSLLELDRLFVIESFDLAASLCTRIVLVCGGRRLVTVVLQRRISTESFSLTE
jgi:hypothetical protein